MDLAEHGQERQEKPRVDGGGAASPEAPALSSALLLLPPSSTLSDDDVPGCFEKFHHRN